MISHPSEYYENYTPGADTTSRADYTGLEAIDRAWERLLPVLEDECGACAGKGGVYGSPCTDCLGAGTLPSPTSRREAAA